jgi:hypothetical protein
VHQVCLRGERYRRITVKCRKREKQLQSRSRSRAHPRLDISLNNFPRKARVKTQVRPPTFLSSTFRLFFFFIWVIFYCLSQAFFFISSFSLVIFVLPPNNVFVSRTPQRQVRDPTGATAGGELLTRLRAGAIITAKAHPHRSPASGSGQHRSNYGQSFLFLAEICHQKRTICSVNLRNPSYLVDAQVR